MKKIEKWVIEEKSKKAAFKRASRMALVIQTPFWILMCALIFTGFPSLLGIAFLVVVWLTVFLVSYDIYYGKYRKMFSEEAEKERKPKKVEK